ncbi:MAG: hypothetical protein HWE13_11635 [Gammaproteobacteria bacterium]|nr:hypothetical protein [Gammaproteobacteria bacterium]NVK88774.1 hypothetical protein [Gammaproteobacteria bacterium]
MDKWFSNGVKLTPVILLGLCWLSLSVAASDATSDANPAFVKQSDSQNTSERDRDALQSVVVAEPFVNLYTGPGVGYPVFHVVEKGEFLWLVKRKYNWFLVVSKDGKEGWVPLLDMQKTKNHDGSDVTFATFNERDFTARSFEVGVKVGDFEGANLIAVSGSWQWTPNLAAELVVGQGLGDFSEVRQTTIAMLNSPWPEWQYSPYFGVGTGIVKVFPSAALVQEIDRKDEAVFVAAGIKRYVSDRFLLRMEYRKYAILTSQPTNEEIEEWTVGFNIFF